MVRREELMGDVLSIGPHDSRADGVCALEWCALAFGEKHTDRPRSVSPTTAAFYRLVNDGLDDVRRQELLPFLPRLRGTSQDGLEANRGFVLADFAVRRFLPVALNVLGEASTGRSLVSYPVAHAGTISKLVEALDGLTVGFERGAVRYLLAGVIDSLEALADGGFQQDRERFVGYLFDVAVCGLDAPQAPARDLASRVLLDCSEALIAPSRGPKGWAGLK